MAICVNYVHVVYAHVLNYPKYNSPEVSSTNRRTLFMLCISPKTAPFYTFVSLCLSNGDNRTRFTRCEAQTPKAIHIDYIFVLFIMVLKS